MNRSKKLTHAAVVISSTFLAGSVQGALVASLLPESLSLTDQQSISGVATRTTTGNLDTRGEVAGTISLMSGHEVGTSSYNGIDASGFSSSVNYQELNRFLSATAGGLIVWDFDLSGALSGTTIGAGLGESSFALNVEYSGRRTSSGSDGLWFVSYNGGGLSLDTSDITSHTVGGTTSGSENFNLVSNAALYQNVLALPANAGAGSFSVPLTAEIAAIAAGDGLVRIAYLEREFRGDIIIENESGIVETVNVPEPGSLVHVGFGVVAGFARRRR